MRVLLTGSTGFLGQHVDRYLHEKTDWSIIYTEKHDLLTSIPELGEFDYIVHLASASSVERSVANPAEFIEGNIKSTLAALEYARKHKPKVFLHMSTVEVYNVTNPYAASKAAQEEIANAYWKTYGVPVVIARSSNIIGEGQSKEKFVPKVIEQIKEGKTVKIYTSGGIIGKRVYNTATNVADAILYLLAMYPATYAPEANQVAFPSHFDIDGGTEVDNLQMAEIIANKLGKDLNYVQYEPDEVRPAYVGNLITTGVKLQDYGWKPVQTLEEGLKWIK